MNPSALDPRGWAKGMPPVESALQTGLSLAAFKKAAAMKSAELLRLKHQKNFQSSWSTKISSDPFFVFGVFWALFGKGRDHTLLDPRATCNYTRQSANAQEGSKGTAARHWVYDGGHLAVPDWGSLQVDSHFLSLGFTTKSQARHETVCESTVLSHSLLACNSAGMMHHANRHAFRTDQLQGTLFLEHRILRLLTYVDIIKKSMNQQLISIILCGRADRVMYPRSSMGVSILKNQGVSICIDLAIGQWRDTRWDTRRGPSWKRGGLKSCASVCPLDSQHMEKLPSSWQPWHG